MDTLLTDSRVQAVSFVGSTPIAEYIYRTATADALVARLKEKMAALKVGAYEDLSAYGPDGARFYTRRKTVTQRWPSAAIREGISFSFPG